MNFFKLYVLALIIFLAIDFLWLGFIAKNFYRENLSYHLADQFKLIPGLVFYLIYIFGLVFFSIYPGFLASDLLKALYQGALFGLVCYATYDLTNYATLKVWPVKVVIIDLAWGLAISSVTSFFVTLIGVKWKGFFS